MTAKQMQNYAEQIRQMHFAPHPLFKREYAKENLISLLETMTLLILGTAIITLISWSLMLTMHIFPDSNFLALVTFSLAIKYMFFVPKLQLQTGTATIFSTVIYVIVYAYTKAFFEKLKLKFHPGYKDFI